MLKKLRNKYYNKLVTTRENGNIKSHGQEENKLNSTINAKSGFHTLTHDKIIKVHSIRMLLKEKNSNNDLIDRACRIGAMLPM